MDLHKSSIWSFIIELLSIILRPIYESIWMEHGLHNWFMERRDWIMQLKNVYMQRAPYFIYGTRSMEFHDYTRDCINNHGVPCLILELHNWNGIIWGPLIIMEPPLALHICTPYVLNKHTGPILTECVSSNLYDSLTTAAWLCWLIEKLLTS